MTKTEIEKYVTEYLVKHGGDFKDKFKADLDLFLTRKHLFEGEFESTFRMAYRNFLVELVKDEICDGFSLNSNDILDLVDYGFLERYLGKEFFEY